MSLTGAFTEIITELGYTANTTYADSGIDINIYQEAQMKDIEFLKKIAQYADHLFYRKPTTNEWWLVDKLTGITPIYDLNGYSLITEEAPNEPAPTGTFFLQSTIQEFEQTDYTLKPTISRVEQTTPTDAGPDIQVPTVSQPVAISGSDLVYDFANHDYILDRKNSIYQKVGIIAKQERYHNVQEGQFVSFDNDRASGSGVVTFVEHTASGKDRTIYTILGSYTQK